MFGWFQDNADSNTRTRYVLNNIVTCRLGERVPESYGKKFIVKAISYLESTLESTSNDYWIRAAK